MDRRAFPQSAAFVAKAAASAAVPQAVPRIGKASTRRRLGQRWVIDDVIKANGTDWNPPRSVHLNAPSGFGASGIFLPRFNLAGVSIPWLATSPSIIAAPSHS
ncbi:MAG TPA: hypothetical protein VL993_10760 [Stellaceae bacterium]|nr:hypothetical protein [Stellaceae bacterium]